MASEDPEELKLEIDRLERRIGAYEIAVKRMARSAPDAEKHLAELDAGLDRANEIYETHLIKLAASRLQQQL